MFIINLVKREKTALKPTMGANLRENYHGKNKN